MRRLARASFRRRRWVLAAWLLLLLVLVGAVSTIGSGYNDQFTLPNTESSRALDLLKKVSPAASGAQLTAVVHVSSGSVTDPAVRAAFDRALGAAKALPAVASVASPYDTGKGRAPHRAQQVSKDGRTAFATVTLTGQVPGDVTQKQAQDVVDAVHRDSSSSVEIEMTGAAAQGQPGQGIAEVVGLLAAAVVLFLVFGSLLGMALPLITAVLSIAVSLSAIGLLAHAFAIATFAPTLSVLLGLGVGVDYALFLVTRYRQGLLEGKTPEEATVTAVDTSGRAVLFAGITVCIALLGLFALGLTVLYGVAVAASLAVATTVVANLTLLPALLGFFGRKVLSRKLRRADPSTLAPADGRPSGGWARWTRSLDRHPLVLALGAVVLMLAVGAPALNLRLGLTDQGSDAAGSTTRKGYDLLAQGFGPGFNGPLLVVTDLKTSADQAVTANLSRALTANPDVAAVTPTVYLGGPKPGVPAAGGVGLTTVYPRSAPQDAATSDLVKRVRDHLVPPVEKGTRQQLLVGGSTAIGDDFSSTIAGKLPLFILVVVLLSFLLLTAVFRSLVVSTVAAVMNLLSAAAAFGVVVAVFQNGVGLSLLGVDRTGPILAFLPVILFAILFGLSMDYEVFLLSRIHEEWLYRRNNRDAVMYGLAATGRTITAAAAIMVMLFLAFVLGPDLTIKVFGLGLAAAVLLDALVVRSVLVPALMLMLGKANWYLPRWLDRVLPHLSVEGPAESEPEPEPEPEPDRRPVPV